MSKNIIWLLIVLLTIWTRVGFTLPPDLPATNDAEDGLRTDLQGIAEVVKFKTTTEDSFQQEGHLGHSYGFSAKIRLNYSGKTLAEFYHQKTPLCKIADFNEKYETLQYLLLMAGISPDHWEKFLKGKVVGIKCISRFLKINNDWKYDGVYCGKIGTVK